jgi:tRNA dimethylallyltransferase
MVKGGMAEETWNIFQTYGDCPGLETLGYPQAMEYRRGMITEEEFTENLALLHFHYAKKQITWFKREPDLVKISRTALKENLINHVNAQVFTLK